MLLNILNNKEQLSGGRVGKIQKENDKVIRPSNIWTPYIHQFLNYLTEQGFRNVPKPYGINEQGKEVLSFVPGKAYNYPLPKFMLSNEMIISAAELLRKYHKSSQNYISRLSHEEKWMLPTVPPIEVMCHGDFAPYNVTILEGKATGIIDFDTLHPGSKLWDVAYAVYRWVPFVCPSNPDCYFTLDEQITKSKIFLDAYELPKKERKQLPKTMAKRLNNLIHYMKNEADNGNEDFKKNIQDGHLKLYLHDIEYILKNEKKILHKII